jgi:hypothetical protein
VTVRIDNEVRESLWESQRYAVGQWLRAVICNSPPAGVHPDVAMRRA